MKKTVKKTAKRPKKYVAPKKIRARKEETGAQFIMRIMGWTE